MTLINYKNWIPDGTLLFYEKKSKKYSGIVVDNRIYPPRPGMNEGYIHLIHIKSNNGNTDNLYFQILDGDYITMEYSKSILLNPLIE